MASALRTHWAVLVLIAIAGPLYLQFSWHPGLGTIGDDSVSYLNIARWLLDPTDPVISEWVDYQTHFPPLFPVVLALTGGAHNLLLANLLVGGFAVLALAALYGYASCVLTDRVDGFLLTAAFLLLPTAWVSVRGIVPEPLYLLLVLGFLWFCRVRYDDQAPSRVDALIAGVLLGAAWLTRSAAAALVAAYVVYAGLRLARSRGLGWLNSTIPVIVTAVMAVAWMLLMPAHSEAYDLVLRNVRGMITSSPLNYAYRSLQYLAQSWVASFALTSQVGLLAKVLIFALGLLGLAGTIARAIRNRLDAWYVLASLGMLFLWLFPESQMRRLLYPVVPLLLLHAAWALRQLTARLTQPGIKKLIWAIAIGLPFAVVLPADLLVVQRAQLRKPVLATAPYTLAGMRDLYTRLGTREARALAAGAVAMLRGFDSVRTATAPDARIMWMRPDYVAVLTGRHGVPWYYGEGMDGLLRRALDARVDYVIASNTYKGDMRGEQSERFDDFSVLSAFADPVIVVANAELGINEFVLLRVDRSRLEALIAEGLPAHR